MFRKSLMALAIASLTAGSAWAAVSADEAKQLGTTLTPIGAEKAANKDGTDSRIHRRAIKPPANFQAGSGLRTDPYASEKPRLVITGKDMAAQADKLTEGTKELLKRYPTMRVDVYPTHRTVRAAAARARQHAEERHRREERPTAASAIENVLPGFPFPIPKTGYEAMWNHLLRYDGHRLRRREVRHWNVDSAGVPTLADHR